ncbi:MAG: SMP-30/gluconolactonase/LRE family protein [Pseudomonadota bacterium]
MKIECVVDARANVGEGPVWDGVAGVLWWTDIEGRKMHCYDPSTGTDREFSLAERVGSFALREQGGFILAVDSGFAFWSPERPDHLDYVHDPEPERAKNRFNDGCCDREGRFVASSMNLEEPKQPTGAIYRFDPNQSCVRLIDGIHIGNGIAFSPDGGTAYAADTVAQTVWKFRYDQAAGALHDREVFISTEKLAGMPDGATVDAEGRYWLAGVFGWHLYVFSPEGKLERTIDMPVKMPSRPMFGGEDLDELYVTTIAGSGPLDPEQPQAGGLFRITGLGAQGLPEPRFKG